MSSDPNTPDFDSMSPEEMMAWMESLAKRQGADASGFTTAADMDVQEVDPDSVDDEILNQKYIPDGWTEERWDAHLAKEEAEKQARLAAEQAAAPPTPEPAAEVEPEPEPEPVEAVGQAAAGDDGTPDFDSMSPEEMMAWMETLAKRQGADEGFTSSIEMEVAEVDPNTVDESILNQKYIPGNMSEEAWDEYLEKEERKKAEKQANQEAAPEPILDILDDDDDEDEELGLPVLDIQDMEPESTTDDGNPMAWLENLASTDEESEELDLPDLSGLGDDLGGLSELASESEGDPMDWLASLAGDVDESPPELDLGDMSAGLEGLEAFAFDDDASDDDIDDEDESLAEADLDNILIYEDDEDYTEADSESFLESLARLEGAPEDELATDANTPIPDFLNMEDDDLDIEDILEDTQPSEELEPAFDIDDPSSLDNPEAWLDALAANNNESPDPMSLFDDDEDSDDDDEALLAMMDDIDDDDDDGTGTQVIEALNQGQDVSPEDIQGFFEGMFDRANTEFAHLDDAVDDDDVDDDEVGDAVAIDMPDWLQELSGGAVTSEDADEEDEAEAEGEDLMADVLAGIEEDIEEEDDDGALPDWLEEGSGDDTGDVIADIIADELDVAPGETAIISMGSGKQIEVDPNDTWTQAFLMEDREEEAEEWYTERLTQVDVDAIVSQAITEEEPEPAEDIDMTTVQMTSPPGVIALEPATFPIEESLPEGEPELAPEWLTGETPPAPALMPDFSAITDDEEDIDIPDWLESSIDEDDIEIPDWLSDESDDLEEEIPDWLADAGVEELEPAAIPGWLTDTMEDEPADLVAQVVETPDPEPAAPAIVQVQSPPPAADIAATIQAAQEKVANNDLDSALQDYESVVRANDGLDVVVSDLQKLTKNDTHKKNPAVYRVLGDAMMRNGDLQDALDVYRRALNLL
jgi:hypothetical protein